MRQQFVATLLLLSILATCCSHSDSVTKNTLENDTTDVTTTSDTTTNTTHHTVTVDSTTKDTSTTISKPDSVSTPDTSSSRNDTIGLDSTIQFFSDSLTTIQWYTILGGSGKDSATAITHAHDNGFVITGYTYSTDGDVSSNNGSADCWVIKLDTEGSVVWEKTYGGSNDECANKIQKTDDGGYIIAGYTSSSDGDISMNHGGKDFLLIKLTSSGEVSWEMTYGGSKDESVYDIKQTSDGGYIITGYSFSGDGDVTSNYGNEDIWVIKTGDTGTIEWEKSFGGSYTDLPFGILITEDGGYFINAASRSSDNDIAANNGYFDAVLMKLDTSGNLMWEYNYGGSSTELFQNSIEINGVFINAGYAGSSNGDLSHNYGNTDDWIISIDSSGVIKWQYSNGGSSTDAIHQIIACTDNTYITAGMSRSKDSDSPLKIGPTDCKVMKITQDGSRDWSASIGSIYDDHLTGLLETDDNCFVISGSVLPEEKTMAPDIFIVKLKR